MNTGFPMAKCWCQLTPEGFGDFGFRGLCILNGFFGRARTGDDGSHLRLTEHILKGDRGETHTVLLAERLDFGDVRQTFVAEVSSVKIRL